MLRLKSCWAIVVGYSASDDAFQSTGRAGELGFAGPHLEAEVTTCGSFGSCVTPVLVALPCRSSPLWWIGACSGAKSLLLGPNPPGRYRSAVLHSLHTGQPTGVQLCRPADAYRLAGRVGLPYRTVYRYFDVSLDNWPSGTSYLLLHCYRLVLRLLDRLKGPRWRKSLAIRNAHPRCCTIYAMYAMYAMCTVLAARFYS